jgi:predicted CopG family antitoxin
MATKTISLKMEAYNKLKSARRYPGESFSEIVLRASWPEETVTAGEFLELCRERGPVYTTEMVERVEKLKEDDEPAEDKWESR